MKEQIHKLHERAANAALNARASLIEARLCAGAGYAGHAVEWIELAAYDTNTANGWSQFASQSEAKHGSVFPGVKP